MLVEVRAIDKPKWHGKKGKENFMQPITIECLYDNRTGKYATGLDADDKTRLETLTGYDLSDGFGEKPHPFWNSATAKIKLPVTTSIFNTTKPIDEIKVKVLKASKYVANSQREYEEGFFPEATHVIFDEAEEAQIKASKIQRRNQAIKISAKMTVEEKANIIQILSGKSVREQSSDFLEVEIDRLIQDDVLRFLEFAKADKSDIYLRASILEGIHRNILTKEGSAILYMGDMLGHNIEEAIKYFNNPQNQSIKASILEKLTN